MLKVVLVRVDADLIILGGGAGGLGAARAARRRGARVTLVNDGPLGGDCTFYGCVPSKTLLRASREGLEFPEAIEDVHRVVAAIAASEDMEKLRSEGVEVIEGRGVFADAASIEVLGRTLRSKRMIIATGARAAVPPVPGLSSVPFVTNETIFNQKILPPRLAILGGGPIGVEMAEAFSRLGSKVTVIEAASRLLSREEPESSEAITDFLEGLHVAVRVSTSCTSVRSSDGGIQLELDSGVSIEADQLLVAVGRRPSSSSLGLDRANVDVDDKGFIVVDDKLRSSVPHIYAVGDVAQALQFTHVADETARIAVTNSFSRVATRRFHPEWVPQVTYTGLEVARVGGVESQAPSGSRVAFLPMTEFDRARMSGEQRGFVKIIVSPRRFTRDLAGGEIFGATIVAPRAGEMIQGIVLAMRSRMWPARLATTTSAYPSWSLAVQQTAAQFFGDFGGRSARPSQLME